MLEIGAGGELLVAYIRVALIAFLLMLPLASAFFLMPHMKLLQALAAFYSA